jgi:hypothetical protein
MPTTSKLLFIESAMIIFLLMNCCFKTQAQIISARVLFTPTTNNLNMGNFQIELTDSTGFSEVEVKLVDAMKDSLLFERIYAFDQITGLPTNITWQRTGTKVQMGMGTFSKSLAWKGKVRVKNSGGIWGEWMEFLFN